MKFLDLDFAFNDTCYTPRPCTATNQMEVQAELLYRGCCSRRFVPGNINYLDHNILSLQNRTKILNTEKIQDPFYESIDETLRKNSPIPSPQ